MFMCCGGGCAWLPSHDGRRTGVGSFHVMLNSPSETLGTVNLAFTMNKSWTMT